jgi:hypothetical protein
MNRVPMGEIAIIFETQINAHDGAYLIKISNPVSMM